MLRKTIFVAGLASMVALLVILGAASVEADRKDAVRLQDIEVLTFTRGDYTKGRRRSAVPQLKCIGGGAKGKYEPHTAMCKNVGFDGRDVAWKCETDLPSEYSLGKVTVTCEGYDYPEDSFVLRDSCGLEYNLEYSETTPRQHVNHNPQPKVYARDRGFLGNTLHTMQDWLVSIISFPMHALEWIVHFFFKTSTTFLKLVTAIGGLFIGLSLFRALTSRSQNKVSYPKSARPPQTVGPTGLAGGSQERSTGPGFWTGVLGGGLASYFMTRNNNKEVHQRPDGTWDRVPADVPANAPPPPPETHESIAYGKTKRR